MRNALLLSLLLVASTSVLAGAPDGAARTPQASTGATTQKPRTPARGAQPAPAQARGGMALTVTDPAGATLAGVKVDANGPTMRSGTTNASGQINFTGMQAGTYRLTFSGEEVTAFERFWPAEDYHDDYYRRNPEQPYCRVVIEPKVAKFRKQYLSRLKRGANR